MTTDSTPGDADASRPGGEASDPLARWTGTTASEVPERLDATDCRAYVREVLDDGDELSDREYVRAVVRQSRPRTDRGGRPLFSSVLGDWIDEVR